MLSPYQCEADSNTDKINFSNIFNLKFIGISAFFSTLKFIKDMTDLS